MTLAELHRNFDLEMDKSNSISNYPSFLPEEKDYFFNTTIQRILKTKYSGDNVHKTGFQQDQKRSDDLRTVVKTKEYISTDFITEQEPSCVRYSVDYPADYLIGLGETVYIQPIGNTDTTLIKRNDVTECTIENIDGRITDNLSEYHYNRGYARPLRLYSENKIYLYTDGAYEITKYIVTYMFMPAKLDWYSGSNTVPLTMLPEHMWDEILVYAVKLALQNVSDERLSSYSQETQVIE